MRTPFDTVLRTRRREIDQMRIAIHAETKRLQEIDKKREALEQELAQEYQACAESFAVSSEAFLRRRLSQQAQLLAQRDTVSGEVSRLRREALEAYGSQHVLENAAEAFRADRKRQQSQAEQRETDDLRPVRITITPRSNAGPTDLRLPAR